MREIAAVGNGVPHAKPLVDTPRDVRRCRRALAPPPRPCGLRIKPDVRWEDIFWFSFYHEAAHIVLHRKKHIFLEGIEASSDEDRDLESRAREEEADRFAARILIPPEHDADPRRLTLTDIPDFAEQLGIAPGIVVGRLQHDSLIPHYRGNELRHRLPFSD